MTKETMTIHQGLAELKILDSRIYNTVATQWQHLYSVKRISIQIRRLME